MLNMTLLNLTRELSFYIFNLTQESNFFFFFPSKLDQLNLIPYFTKVLYFKYKTWPKMEAMLTFKEGSCWSKGLDSPQTLVSEHQESYFPSL